MKLFVVALCFCVAMAEVEWDQSGQYRLIERSPIDVLQYKMLDDPLLRINDPLDARFRIVDLPLPKGHPAVYRYLTAGLPETRLTNVEVKTTEPFVYSYKQINKEA